MRSQVGRARSVVGMVRSVAIASTCIGIGLAASGCALGSLSLGSRVPTTLDPAGPGTVFSTIDEAAVDGLAYAYLEAPRVDRARGGTVHRVERGYSYELQRVAPSSDPDRVEIVLRDRDVAHFATYRKGTSQENRLNERHSLHDRRNVDRVDPQHRPAFILTPSLQVRGYGGNHGEFIASIIAGARDVATTQ